MALDFTFNTPVTDQTGDSLDTAYGRLSAELTDNEDSVYVKLSIYKTLNDRLNNRAKLKLDEIPAEIMSIVFPLTPLEWLVLDMGAIHDDYIDILKSGAGAPKYPQTYNQNWLGLEDINPTNDVVKVMPA